MPPPLADLPPLIGESRAFLDVIGRVSEVAPLDRPVLVVGERGTGKELIAARLHYLSVRWDRPFVKLNCAALPETLLETELFGHEAGAFTGAVRRRMGRFERADGGTLFLDEIASAPLAVQEKILRVVEYGEFERVGASETIRVDVRVVAAANVDLPSEADVGRFRHDLLDRLAFDVLTVPPLSARPEDVPVLAAHFARTMAIELGWEAFPGFSESALAAMAVYPWPGNVRELKNVAERAVYRWPEPDTAIDAIVFDPFASPYRPGGGGKPEPPPETGVPPTTEPPAPLSGDFEAAVAAFEADILERAMDASRHNQRAAASLLGLGYHQFRNRLSKHGLLPSRGASG